MKGVEKIRCIYCKKMKSPTREHAVQKALGGNLVLKYVCGKCNRDFSSIDQSLAENSLVSLSRIIEQADEKHVKLGGDHFVEIERCLYEVEIRGGLKPILKPQIGFKEVNTNYELVFACSSKEDVIAIVRMIKKYVKDDKVGDIYIKDPSKYEEIFLPTLVLHREKELYFRPSRNMEDSKAFLLKLFEKLSPRINGLLEKVEKQVIDETKTHNKPHVKMSMSYNLNNIHRAIAKTMFNIVAYKLGADYVLKKVFDEIRLYIKGDRIIDTQVNENDIVYDRRFVIMLSHEDGEHVRWVKKRGSHSALLYNKYPCLVGYFDFYGNNMYLVNFGDVKYEKELMEFISFDYKNRVHFRTKYADIMRHVSEKVKKC